jgi:AcrR family transcriptional regulator
MNKNQDTKQRIIEAAIKEFAFKGFGGARMDTIAREAQINKAMLFYYFTSKENLYNTIITDVVGQYINHIKSLLKPSLSPEKMLEQLPRIVITFFSKKLYFIRIVGVELLNNPENITSIMSPLIRGYIIDGPFIISKMVNTWYKMGLISEKDPVHFMMNIMSLCMGSFVARPMVEGIFKQETKDEQQYIEQRINSIINVLKNGMLTR